MANAGLIEYAIVNGIANFPGYLPEVLRQGFVIDGEFFTSNWNAANSAVMTEDYDKELAKTLRLNAFDIIPIEDWDNRKCFQVWHARQYLLKQVIDNTQSKRLQLLPSKRWSECPSFAEMKTILKINVKLGHEGFMLKDLFGLYEFKRTTAWLKMKPVETYDFKVIGFKEECDKHGTPKGTLGSLRITGSLNGKKITTWCGGGYKRQERIDLWKRRKSLIGKIIELKFDIVTVGDATRFPRFKRLRLDK